ncbi:MAG: nucleoside triphosphate pyrophosphatase [Cyanobacteriota bacterium]|nr:nucleoside triphosphate pyrophosphatase [Cyanobacteriota bacterium]
MLLLASASPARRRLLEQAGIPHRVLASGVDEDAIHDPEPVSLVRRLAEAKAQAVAAQLGAAWELPGGGACEALLACDSLLSLAGEVYGKPRDPEEAMDRWLRMRGQWAELHTGHCLLQPGVAGAAPADRLKLETVSTRLLFARVEEAEIRRYVATGEPLACAGCFALEGAGGLLIERLEGCWSNVIGLSLPLLRRWLPGLCFRS